MCYYGLVWFLLSWAVFYLPARRMAGLVWRSDKKAVNQTAQNKFSEISPVEISKTKHFLYIKFLKMTIPTLYEKIYKIIAQIPKGKVATYGHIAALAGNPRAARTVGWVLNSSKSEKLPWHRVINAQGRSSFPDKSKRMLQQSMLEAEGIIFKNETVDLDIFLWDGKSA